MIWNDVVETRNALSLRVWFSRFFDRKNPWYIKSKMDVAFAPLARGFGDHTLVDHGGGIGKMQLEYVAPGFDVDAQWQRVGINACDLIG